MSLLCAEDLQKIKEEISQRQAKFVGIQVPEGMKVDVQEILEFIEKNTQAKAIAFMEPCYGACDLADDKAKVVGCDLLIHFGHSRIYAPSVPTVFVPIRYDIDIEKVAPKVAQNLLKEGIHSIALSATTQYLHRVPELSKALEENGVKAYTAKGTPRVQELAQVLGCNYSTVHPHEKEADALLYFGDGMFHPLGLALSTTKPVWVADANTGEIRNIEKDREQFLRKRYAGIALAQKAKAFAVIVGTKRGQLQKVKALKAKELIEKHGKKAFLVGLEIVKDDFLLGLNVDCYVNTSCPRITTDDPHLFKKPMVSLQELEMALGERKMSEIVLDEIP